MRRRHGLVLSLALTLAACGGGGGGGGTAQPTAPPPLVDDRINGLQVPPQPDAASNRLSVAGIDTDKNGIRDDLDRLIATQFGTNTGLYDLARQHARTQQAALLAPSPENVNAHVAVIRCISDAKRLSDLKLVTAATLDTPARQSAYATAFAGAALAAEGCTP